jgi:hypothetical protein
VGVRDAGAHARVIGAAQTRGSHRAAIDFGYQSVTEQVRYLTERLGLDLAAWTTSLDDLELLRAERNLLVHHNGATDRAYCRLVKRIGGATSCRAASW